jgi:hypothetical protein
VDRVEEERVDVEPGGHGQGVSRRRVLLGGAAATAAGVAWVAPSIQSAQAQPPGTPPPVSATLTVLQNSCAGNTFEVRVGLVGPVSAVIRLSRSVAGGPFVVFFCDVAIDDTSGSVPITTSGAPSQVIAELVTGTCAAPGTVLACEQSVICSSPA